MHQGITPAGRILAGPIKSRQGETGHHRTACTVLFSHAFPLDSPSKRLPPLGASDGTVRSRLLLSAGSGG